MKPEQKVQEFHELLLVVQQALRRADVYLSRETKTNILEVVSASNFLIYYESLLEATERFLFAFERLQDEIVRRPPENPEGVDERILVNRVNPELVWLPNSYDSLANPKSIKVGGHSVMSVNTEYDNMAFFHKLLEDLMQWKRSEFLSSLPLPGDECKKSKSDPKVNIKFFAWIDRQRKRSNSS